MLFIHIMEGERGLARWMRLARTTAAGNWRRLAAAARGGAAEAEGERPAAASEPRLLHTMRERTPL